MSWISWDIPLRTFSAASREPDWSQADRLFTLAKQLQDSAARKVQLEDSPEERWLLEVFVLEQGMDSQLGQWTG